MCMCFFYLQLNNNIFLLGTYISPVVFTDWERIQQKDSQINITFLFVLFCIEGSCNIINELFIKIDLF